MDYEKRYKEVVDSLTELRCIGLHEQSERVKDWIRDTFPELYESEEERIPNRLIRFFEEFNRTRSHCYGVPVPEIIEWLKRQKEKEAGRKEVNDE